MHVIEVFLINKDACDRSFSHEQRCLRWKVDQPLESFKMNINFILKATGGTFSLMVSLCDKVLEIKQKIQTAIGIPVDRQSLIVLGRAMENRFEAKHYNIDPNVPLHLEIIPQPGKLLLLVKLPSKQFCKEMDVAENLSDLKRMIQDHEGILSHRLVIFIHGERVKDFRFLGEFGLRDLSEIGVLIKPVNLPRIGSRAKQLRLVIKTSELHGSANIPLEMSESSSVDDLKQELMGYLPPEDYFFVYNQEVMEFNCSLRRHGVKNGDVVHVFKGTVSGGN